MEIRCNERGELAVTTSGASAKHKLCAVCWDSLMLLEHTMGEERGKEGGRVGGREEEGRGRRDIFKADVIHIRPSVIASGFQTSFDLSSCIFRNTLTPYSLRHAYMVHVHACIHVSRVHVQ